MAISDGRIAEVGQVTGAGREEIDATDRIVIPGFVDVHTHYDAQVTWANQILPSSANGVTTVLMGNCGVGFAAQSARSSRHADQSDGGLRTFRKSLWKEGLLPWNWAEFPGLSRLLEGNEYDVDVATQVPHAALRVFVMGERGANREELQQRKTGPRWRSWRRMVCGLVPSILRIPPAAASDSGGRTGDPVLWGGAGRTAGDCGCPGRYRAGLDSNCGRLRGRD